MREMTIGLLEILCVGFCLLALACVSKAQTPISTEIVTLVSPVWEYESAIESTVHETGGLTISLHLQRYKSCTQKEAERAGNSETTVATTESRCESGPAQGLQVTVASASGAEMFGGQTDDYGNVILVDEHSRLITTILPYRVLVDGRNETSIAQRFEALHSELIEPAVRRRAQEVAAEQLREEKQARAQEVERQKQAEAQEVERQSKLVANEISTGKCDSERFDALQRLYATAKMFITEGGLRFIIVDNDILVATPAGAATNLGLHGSGEYHVFSFSFDDVTVVPRDARGNVSKARSFLADFLQRGTGALVDGKVIHGNATVSLVGSGCTLVIAAEKY